MTTLGDEKYVSLTTFKKDGTPVPLPVWVGGAENGDLHVITEEGAWKVKRIRNNPSVRVQPCDMRGNLTDGTEECTGTARLITHDEPAFLSLTDGLRRKYGLSYSFFSILAKIRGRHQVGIAITLDEAPSQAE